MLIKKGVRKTPVSSTYVRSVIKSYTDRCSVQGLSYVFEDNQVPKL
jgi:hypothetical protein